MSGQAKATAPNAEKAATAGSDEQLICNPMFAHVTILADDCSTHGYAVWTRIVVANPSRSVTPYENTELLNGDLEFSDAKDSLDMRNVPIRLEKLH